MKLILVTLLLLSLDATAQVMRPTSFDGRMSCEKSRGVWRQFGNGCGNECFSKFDEFAVCPDAIISACDCGKGRCWQSDETENFGSCVSLSEYQKIFDQQQEADHKLLNKAKNERLARYKKQRRKIMDKFVQQNSVTAEASATDENGNPKSPSNNLGMFYKNTLVQNNAQNLIPINPEDAQKNNGLLSVMVDDKGVKAPDSTLPPQLATGTQNNVAGAQQGAQAGVPNGVPANTATSAAADANASATNTTNATTAPAATPAASSTATPAKKTVTEMPIGLSPASQNPHQQLMSNKSLIQSDGVDDQELPQLPMPQ